MPWFKVDDRAHGHPKVMAAGTAAYGLWARCGSYSAEHLTDGYVPKSVARMYGTPAMARALLTSGLWHTDGHDCPRCAQPAKGDYVMHDYLDHNPSRREVEGEREAARERMRKRRRSGDVRPNNGRTNPGKAVTNSHHEVETEFETNESGRAENSGARRGVDHKTPGNSLEEVGGSPDVRANTRRTSDGVRGPRPRPGVPTELSPRASDASNEHPDTPTGHRPEDRAGERENTNTNLALIANATDATTDEAAVLLDRVRTELRPRSLPGLLRTIAANGDLQTLLDEHRTTAATPRISPRDEWMYRQ